jgi:putative NIF3 family GTP cyclohydrolase 1 type 2
LPAICYISGIRNEEEDNGLNAWDVQNHLNSLNGGWVNPELTVDTFKSGDPTKELTGIAVAWMSYTEAIQRALDLNCNLLITHEPTYYDHWDKDESVFRFPQAQAKKALIEKSGIIILRCHDLWDQIPDLGVPDSWGDSFGYGKAVGGEGYFRVYDGGGHTVHQIATQIAAVVKKHGQEEIQLIGSADQIVQRFVVGTGAVTPLTEMMERYPDAQMFVCSDDGFVYWHDGAMAIDFNIPVVIANHPVTEFDGIKSLYAYLKKEFSQIPVHYLDQSCMFQMFK